MHLYFQSSVAIILKSSLNSLNKEKHNKTTTTTHTHTHTHTQTQTHAHTRARTREWNPLLSENNWSTYNLVIITKWSFIFHPEPEMAKRRWGIYYSFVYFLPNVSTAWRLFNVKIWLIYNSLIVIVTTMLMFHCILWLELFLFVYDNCSH